MGFFDLKTTCGVCHREIGMNRFKLAKSNDWCCAECMKKARKKAIINVYTMTSSEIRDIIEGRERTVQEFRKKCNVCGKVFCYTSDDLQKNVDLADKAVNASVSAALGALSGTRTASATQQGRADSILSQMVDYSRCPYCKSTKIVDITEEELQALQQRSEPATTISASAEIKNFKELLDLGIITQEEFDAKKKQLLGL